MAESKRYGLQNQLGIEHILLQAQHRWLRPAEICEILRNYKKFRVASEPGNMPPSGSLFLFDRKVLRYFRKDGHNWRKKKDGKTVKEAHERLKDGSVDVLHCYYAHGEENGNLQRRSYWMLEEELSHIVLVHYLEVKGTRANFKYAKDNEEALPYAQQNDETTMPSSEMDASMQSSHHPNSYQVPSQTMDTASFSSAQASEYEEAESAFNNHATSQFYSFFELQQSIVEKTNAKLPDPHHPLPILNDQGKLSGFPGVDYISLDQANKTKDIDAAALMYEPQKSLGLSSWEDILKNNAESQPIPFHHRLPKIQPNTMGINSNSSQGDELMRQPFTSRTAKQHENWNLIQAQENWQASGCNSSCLPSWPPTDSVHPGLVSEVSSRHHDQEVNEVDFQKSLEKHLVHPDKQNRCLGKNDPQDRLLSEKDNNKVKSDLETSMSLDEIDDNTYFTLKQTLLDGPAKLDSFNRWMSKELGDVDELNIQSTSGAYWDTVESQNGVDSPTFSPHVHLGTDHLDPSISHCQLFSIVDYSPSWTYENLKTKVLISGKFLRSPQEVENCKWSCMFGEVEVPAEIISHGVLRCHTPLHKAGRVPFYVTCSNRLTCSEVREFDFRVNHVQEVKTADKSRGIIFEILKKRFGELLSLESASKHSESISVSEKFQLGSKISSLLREENDKWDKLLKLTSEKDFSLEDVQEQLLQMVLTEKLLAWLLQKITEDGKGPNVLDEGGQGVLHLAAALGYDWALQPTIVSGVNINFRDVNGWTALHWAAFCGRERTVVSLISLGAAPGALTDPCLKYPTGRTPADLASANGHKGIAGYLAGSALSAHLRSLNLSREGGAKENFGAREVQRIGEENKNTVIDGDICELSLKDSLAAVCNATQAAARIHQVYRVQSFQRKQMKEYGDDKKFGLSNEQVLSLITVKSHKAGQHDDPVHAAAIQIQKKFRSWKGRKDFLIIRQRIVKIQAHVRGHQVRKNHRKIIWSVGIVEKVILRWRRKGSGLRGFKSEAISDGSMVQDMSFKEDDYDFLKEGRKQTEERMQKALARVKSMVQYPEARDQYHRLLNVVNEVHETQVKYDRSLNNSEETIECDLIDHEALLDENVSMPAG